MTALDRAVEAVADLHAEVDVAASALAGRLGERITCKRGCSGCCVDDLTVFEVEAELIRRRHGRALGPAHPPGACALLGPAGECTVYLDRPYVCRTQGLPLAWEEEVEGEPAELRDICALNDRGEPPLVALPSADTWTLGPFEARLARLQASVDGGALRRVSLRTLAPPRSG